MFSFGWQQNSQMVHRYPASLPQLMVQITWRVFLALELKTPGLLTGFSLLFPVTLIDALGGCDATRIFHSNILYLFDRFSFSSSFPSESLSSLPPLFSFLFRLINCTFPHCRPVLQTPWKVDWNGYSLFPFTLSQSVPTLLQ